MSQRRTKKPYNPAKDKLSNDRMGEVRGQLGLPTPERRRHAEFEAENLAPETPTGVWRSRVKGLFTTSEQKERLIEIAIKDLMDRGHLNASGAITHEQTEQIKLEIPQTSIDKNFLPAEFAAICWFTRIHARVEGGARSITNYTLEPRSQSHNKLPYSAKEGKERAEYAYVRDRLPEAFLAFLDWVAWVQFPEDFENRPGKAPSKTRVGQSLFYHDPDSPNDKYNRDCVDGYFKAVTQNIAHLRADYDTLLRRKSMVQQEYLAHQKQRAYT